MNGEKLNDEIVSIENVTVDLDNDVEVEKPIVVKDAVEIEGIKENG